MVHQRGIARLDAGQEVALLHPAIREAPGAVESYGGVRGTLRDHPHLPLPLEYERIGKVPRLFENDTGRAARAIVAKRNDRDDAFISSVIQVLDEHERA